LVRHFLVCGTAPTSLHKVKFDATSNVSASAFRQVTVVDGPTGIVPPYTMSPNVVMFRGIVSPAV
jgi:hypothetical protein